MNTQEAQVILDTCALLNKDYCKIVDGWLYEKIDEYPPFPGENRNEHEFRCFFSDDDYDYVATDDPILPKLRAAFAMNLSK